jgi:hypothetical protein
VVDEGVGAVLEHEQAADEGGGGEEEGVGHFCLVGPVRLASSTTKPDDDGGDAVVREGL